MKYRIFYNIFRKLFYVHGKNKRYTGYIRCDLRKKITGASSERNWKQWETALSWQNIRALEMIIWYWMRRKTSFSCRAKKLRFFASGDSDLERMVCFTDQLTLMEKWECIFLIPMEVKLQSVETVSVFLQNILWIMSMLQRKNLPLRPYPEQSK